MRYWVIKKRTDGYSATFLVARGGTVGTGVAYEYTLSPTLRSAIAYAKRGGLMGIHHGEILVDKEA